MTKYTTFFPNALLMTCFKVLFKVPRVWEGWGDRQEADSSLVVSIWIAHVTGGRARVDGKTKGRDSLLSPLVLSPLLSLILIGD